MGDEQLAAAPSTRGGAAAPTRTQSSLQTFQFAVPEASRPTCPRRHARLRPPEAQENTRRGGRSQTKKCGNHLLSPCDYHRPCRLNYRVRNGNGCIPARIVTAPISIPAGFPTSSARPKKFARPGRKALGAPDTAKRESHLVMLGRDSYLVPSHSVGAREDSRISRMSHRPPIRSDLVVRSIFTDRNQLKFDGIGLFRKFQVRWQVELGCPELEHP